VKPIAVPLALSFVLCACTVQQGVEQSSGDGDHVDPTTPIQRYLAADFKSDYIGAVCDWFLGCAATIGSLFPDRASCVSVFGFTFDQGMGEGGDIFDPLLFKVDSVKAAACVQAVKTLACTAAAPAFGSDSNCSGAFIGRLNDGECCDRRGGCAPGMVCEINPNTQPQAGYCTSTGDFGETCYTQQCSSATTCVALGNLQTCLTSLNLGSGEECDYTFDCAPAFACQYVPGEPHPRCLLRPDVGDYCHLDLPCAQGLYCVGSPNGHCSATPGANGDGCDRTLDCGPSLVCISQVCRAYGALGDPCVSNDPSAQCAASLDCVDGVCGHYPVPQKIGDACDPKGPACPSALGQGKCVMGPSGYTCVLPLQENDPCTGGPLQNCDVARGLYCDPGTSTCKQLPKTGEPCTLGLCQPIFTVTCAGPIGAGTCQARKPLGAACTPSPNEQQVIPSECTLFTLCEPDPVTQQNVCTALQTSAKAVCK
jgi:hypothetical protein